MFCGGVVLLEYLEGVVMAYRGFIEWQNHFGMIRQEKFYNTSFLKLKQEMEAQMETIKSIAERYPAKILETKVYVVEDIKPQPVTRTNGVIPYLNEGSTDAEILGLRY